MMQRCENPERHAYPNCRARGVRVEPLYAEFQIDRISNDGNYAREPPVGECQDPGATIGVTQANVSIYGVHPVPGAKFLEPVLPPERPPPDIPAPLRGPCGAGGQTRSSASSAAWRTSAGQDV
jgi:hypothetical protein